MKTRLATLLLVLATAVAAGAHPPVSVVLDSRGNLYYSDLERVWQISPAGLKRVAVGNVHTHELYLDAQDNLFGEQLWYEGERVDKWGHYVWRRSPDGKVATILPRREGFLQNYSFVRDRAGNMFWADRDQNAIRKRAPDGRITILARGLRNMRWMHATPAGTVYVIDGGDLVRVTADGRATTYVKNIGPSARHEIMGLWTDRAENVYVAVTGRKEVKRVSRDGRVAVIAKSVWPWSPTGGAVAPNGDLWILECSVTNQMRVRKVD
jgi:hypothetical protein